MKKSLFLRWIGMSSLFAVLFFGHTQQMLADNLLSCACIGNDTLICDFTYQISPATAGGEWSVLCDSTDGSVDFDMIDATTTQITVSECGDYHLIYTVNDGSCMSADTAVFSFGNPSFGGISADSEADLGYNGTVFCHQSPDPSSCNPVSMGGGPPPEVSWEFCGEGTAFSTIFSTNVQGDMPAVCLADEITVSSESFNAASDLGCMNLTEAEFIDQFFNLFAGSCLPVFDSLNIPFGVQCQGIGQIDTIFNDSIYFDTMTYLIPYRVGGQWNYVTDDGTLSPLNDTTDIVVSDSNLIFIIAPGADYYGPGNLEFTVYVENDMMDWVNPDYDIEMEIQWVEEFAYDTLLQITQTDSITIIAQTCDNFSFNNNFSFSGPPSYPCGPVTLNFNFSTPPDPLMIVGVSTWDDFCGYCDGGAFLEVEGGCPPYSETEFYGLCGGVYTFTVTDANGNVSPPVDVFINEEPPLFINSVTVTDDECEENNGSLTIEVFGGFPPYIYLVNGMSSGSSTFTGLSAGTYDIEVFDNFGCIDFGSATITTTPQATVSITGNLTICPGEQTTLTANGNFDTANWTPGGSGNSITVGEGTYCVMVTTVDGCIAQECVTVTESNNIPVNISGDFEFCENTSAMLTVNGNFATYIWSDGSTSPAISVTEGGTYSVTVSDGMGNTAATSEVVNELPAPMPTILGDAFICEGEVTQLATQNFVSYQWSDGSTTATTTAASTNIYEVIVEGNNGCFGSAAFNVEAVPLPSADVFSNGNIDCINEEVMLDGSNSNGSNLTYNWSTSDGNILGNINDLAINANAAGVYMLTVTESLNNCQSSASITILENTQAPELFLTTNQTLPCDGAIEILPTNTPPNTYNYEWTNADGHPIADATTATPSVELAGTYSVIITDTENGCTNTTATEILANETTPQGVDLALQTPTCFGDVDGQIMVENVIDGSGPFLFSINGSPFIEDMIFAGLPAGSFEVSVESQVSGCVYSEMVTLADGDQINLELGDDLTINLGETVEVGAESFINESIIEGVMWTTTADIACDTCLTNPVLLLENTTFDLTITTENGCVVSDQIQISVTDNTEFFAPNAFSPNNDGMNDRFTIYSNNELLNIKTLAVYDRWGSLVFENKDFIPNDENLGWDGTFNGKSARQGVYIYMAEVEYFDGRKDVMKGDVTVLGTN
jgi:gliding motility-associated-like protein